jgi:hypothetical protein
MSDLPKGWKLVPILARKEMIVAANKHYESEEYTGVSSTYEAMLSASPTPPEAQGESGTRELLEEIKSHAVFRDELSPRDTALGQLITIEEICDRELAIIPSIEQRGG